MYTQDYIKRLVALGLILCFLVMPIRLPQAQARGISLPKGMVSLSEAYIPATLLGMTIDPKEPLKFDFLVRPSQENLTQVDKVQEYTKLIKYFLTSLTVPDKDQWVNLSPYEKDRIIEVNFGKTEMGRDVLAQDFLLKQITSSLMYPESGLGKVFWDKVYAKAWELYHTSNIPVNTFNKVWIVPDEAVVYEHDNTAYIIKSHLKVMLEEDYLANQKNMNEGAAVTGPAQITSQVVREVILPELEREINEGKNFANLRQMVSGMILATWYKKVLKESILGKIYADRVKVNGVDLSRSRDQMTLDQIYQKYITTSKKGIYNYVKEDLDKHTNQVIPRKYFAGGFKNEAQISIISDISKTTVGPGMTERLKGTFDLATVVFGPAKIVTTIIAGGAPSNDSPTDLGGVNLNSSNLAMIIKRDGKGMVLPLAAQDLALLSGIQGLEPHIIEISSTTLPVFNELK